MRDGAVGQIATSSLGASGTNYVAGVTVITLSGGSGSGAQITIDSLGASDSIATYTLVSPGVGYIATESLTVPGGDGAGRITVDSIQRVNSTYYAYLDYHGFLGIGSSDGADAEDPVNWDVDTFRYSLDNDIFNNDDGSGETIQEADPGPGTFTPTYSEDYDDDGTKLSIATNGGTDLVELQMNINNVISIADDISVNMWAIDSTGTRVSMFSLEESDSKGS